MSHADQLALARVHELQVATRFMPPSDTQDIRTLLELGAGTGQQALALQRLGYKVSAIDVPQSHYASSRVFPIFEYDGLRIPADEKTFDVVFTSNALEHIPDIHCSLSEIRRVLKDDGVALHIIPSVSCRAWSYASHYLWLARRVTELIAAAASRKSNNGNQEQQGISHASHPTIWEHLRDLFPRRHGEHGNVFNEMLFYRQNWWKNNFTAAGMDVAQIVPSGLFYTMSNGLTTQVSLSTRKTLARYLGSACNIYVTRKTNRADAS